MSLQKPIVQTKTPKKVHLGDRGEHAASDVEWVDADTLVVDRSYQRTLESNKVFRIATEFDPEAFGTLVVSHRTTGENVIIDGGHRVAAIHILEDVDPSWLDQKLPAVVHRDLTVADEARIFSTLNANRTKPKPGTMFTASTVAGDKDAIEIQFVLDKYGLEVTDTPGGTGIRAVTTVTKIHGKGGADLLDNVLRCLLRAYENDLSTETFNHRLMWPIAAIFYNHPEIDLGRLADRIARLGSPSEIVSRGRATAANSDTKTPNEIGNFLIRRYNVNLRSRRLPEFNNRAYLFGNKAITG